MVKILFGDNRSLRFSVRLTSVAALFVFLGGIMRKVDDLGRIVIPKELRKKYGLVEGADIEFIESVDGVTVKASAHICIICKSPIPEDIPLPICKDCVSKGYDHYFK